LASIHDGTGVWLQPQGWNLELSLLVSEKLEVILRALGGL